MADMSPLAALHRSEKLAGYFRGTRNATAVLLKACYQSSLPLNTLLSLGNVPIGCVQSG
jgi:hypothetical protein